LGIGKLLQKFGHEHNPTHPEGPMQRATHLSRLFIILAAASALLIPAFSLQAGDLSTAPSADLVRVYKDLRSLHSGDSWTVTEGVALTRDSASFSFKEGKLTYAAPVEAQILAASFEGQATFILTPPSPPAQHQLARFTKSPQLQDTFRKATFFFTDDTFSELEKISAIHSGGTASSDAIGEEIKKIENNFNGWWENQAKHSFPMRNLSARMLADLTDPASKGFFLADIKTDHFGDLLFQISWNREPLLLPGLSNDEEVMLIHYDLSNYWEWWGGFHLASEYKANPHPEHRVLLEHCPEEKINAVIGNDNRLSATAVMQIEVPGGALRVLPLQLEGVLRVDSIEDDKGKEVAFIQEDRKLDSDLWLILPEPAKPGASYRVKISYSEDSTHDSRIIDQKGSGLYWVKSRESWYPSFGAFDDRSNFSLHFESPKKYTLVASGEPGKASKEKEAYVSEWTSPLPLSVAGFNYGEFVHKDRSDSRLAVTAYSGKQIPDELEGVNAALSIADLAGGPAHGDAASQYGLLQGGFTTSAMADQAAAVSFQALRLFEYYFGDLPFRTVSVTEQPVRGYGQAWPMLVFLPYDSFLDSTTRNSLHLQSSAEAREFYHVVVQHELSHQWWGHVVGWKTYRDQWLSEGFADFSAGLYLWKADPKEFVSFYNLKRKWLLDNNREGRHPVEVGPPTLGGQLDSHIEPGNFQVVVYYKGAYILEMLRSIMEDSRAPEPDQHFIEMMRDFTSTYRGKNASTGDFQKIVEKHMGKPMVWFFNEWVYDTEVPHYDFSYQLRKGDGGKTVAHMVLKQSGVSDAFYMQVPLYVTMKGKVMRIGQVGVKGSTTTEGDIPLGFTPDSIAIDVYHRILCTTSQ
jgi:Peptidase family M1 domain